MFAGGFFSDRLVSHLGIHSRLWLLFVCTLLAAPLAVGTLHFPPPGAFGEFNILCSKLENPDGSILYCLRPFNEALLLSGCLIAYYFLAETWFAVLFTVIVEIVPPEIR